MIDCAGCTECCRGPDRHLVLDDADLGRYESHGRLLATDEWGNCVYLGDEGCGIYEDRPRVCRRFDCREVMLHPRCPRRVTYAAMRAAFR